MAQSQTSQREGEYSTGVVGQLPPLHPLPENSHFLSVTSKTQQTDGRRGGEERRKVKSKNVGEALKAKEERYRFG